MEVPEDLRYTKEHEWVRDDGDGEVVIGVTDYAQEQLGDIVFVELPEADESTEIARDEPFAVVESVKAASDVYAPVTGTVLEVNDELPESPEMINEDCFGDGWMIRMKISNREELEELLSAAEYRELLAELTS
jgi:glycine cleavage system H protein